MSNKAKIHPTAIVSSNARLHETVEVGAYSIIGDHVELGEGCIVRNHVNLNGYTTLGKNNHIFPFASIGEAPQDKKYHNEKTQLVIGNNNTIREFCTFNTGTPDGGGITQIGDYNWIMAYSHIAHDCVVGNNTIFANGSTLGGHVMVKDWSILGGHVAVHQFCVIGEHSMVAGGTGVAQDIPPYLLASGQRAEPKGINSEGLKRRGFSMEQIDNIKNAYKILYRNGISFADACDQIKELAETQPELQLFVAFFNQSTRGMIR